MADFPPNLADGELYLPSDIYPDELSTHVGSPEVFPSELTCMEELAQEFSSLAVINRPSPQPAPKPPSSTCFEQLRPLLRPQPGFGAFTVADCSRQNPGVFGRGRFCVPPRPVHPLQPFPVQMEPFVRERGVMRLLQRHQNQGQDRFLPFRASGSGAAGSARVSCGTGVFLPRVLIADARRKPGFYSGWCSPLACNLGAVDQCFALYGSFRLIPLHCCFRGESQIHVFSGPWFLSKRARGKSKKKKNP